MKTSDGHRTDYLYDGVGRLIGVWAPNFDYLAFSFDAGGRLTEKWFPNGTTARYTWNADDSLATLVSRPPVRRLFPPSAAAEFLAV